MLLSDRNNAYDPHNNAIFHEGTQKIINRECDNAPYDPNARVNNRRNNGIGDQLIEELSQMVAQIVLLVTTQLEIMLMQH